ncbi:MAG: CRISPR-associated protein Cas4 [Candidatus Zipacnadales bacterium]
MYNEDDLLPISAIPHLVYCKRQCALMYLERLWDENRFTAHGQQLHQRVHDQETETRKDVRLARGLRIRSLRLGIWGQADIVEFHQLPSDSESGCVLEGLPGRWQPFPVEHKRGREKPDLSDEAQLCAQALCLEEMLGIVVPEGAIFYHQPRRRHAVTFTAELRRATEAFILCLHDLIRTGITPPAEYGRKCRNCSLLDLCLPQTAGKSRSAKQYLVSSLQSLIAEGGDNHQTPSEHSLYND